MRSFSLFSAFAFAIAISHVDATVPPNGQPIIVSLPNKDGAVKGVSISSENIEYFKGIPYAGTTGGNNRFMPPVAPDPWNPSVFDATEFGPGCVQTHHNPDVPKIQSEDCLNLNVYKPATSPPSNGWPVMVFFHGGAFLEGSNQGPYGIYEGNYLVSQHDVVVVTANYRLGAYGWVSMNNSVIPGNMGFLDQRKALQWVQSNIKAFDGDVDQVTVWGESAGAMSVGLHLTSPESYGLFSKAIMESNPSAFLYKSEKQASYYGAKFCEALQCSSTSERAKSIEAKKLGMHPRTAPDIMQRLYKRSLRGNPINHDLFLTEEELDIILQDTTCSIPCMQAANTSLVNKAWDKASGNVWAWIQAYWGHFLDGILPFTPTVDGTIITTEPLAAIQQGNFAQVPVLVGTNTNEGATFIYDALDKPLPGWLAPLAYDILFGTEDGKKISAQPRYAASYSDVRVPVSHLATDYLFRCSSEQFATALRKNNIKAFVYRYNHLFSKSEIFHEFGLPVICVTEICHASELPFVFHNDVPQIKATFTPPEARLSATMAQYWTNFAKNGDPNIGGSNNMPPWPVWNPNARENIVLGNGTYVDIYTESSEVLCSFWDSIGYFH